MKNNDLNKAGETQNITFPTRFPRFRIAVGQAGETGETSLVFPPFPRPRCVAVNGGP
jgi:hypothetical protein